MIFKNLSIKCFAIDLKRADAARAALDKAREEEYKRRVGMCGESNEHKQSIAMQCNEMQCKATKCNEMQ